jgi:hypothetical protein
VDALVAQAPDVTALRSHGLQLLAADLRRRRGLSPDPDLKAMERRSAMGALAVPALLARVRKVIEGPILLMRWPEAAASWARPHCRPFKDLDLFVRDAEGAHARMLAAGFAEIPGPSSPDHHTPALAWPGLPLAIELHSDLHPVDGLPLPTLETLFELAGRGRAGAPGVLGLRPEAHAVMLAVHAWAHGPLEQIAPLIDVAAVLADGDRADADRLARQWGCERLWRTTTTCADAVLGGRREPLALRLWGRHLTETREPRVSDAYVARVLAPAWALPRRRAAGGVGAALGTTLRRYQGESWADKGRRSRGALRLAPRPLSEYRSN